VRVFIAGATGVIGRALVPMLVDRGHEVTGMVRDPSKQPSVLGLGARSVVADALDRDAVIRAVLSVRPDVVVHELTALGAPMSLRDPRDPARSAPVVLTGRLRTEGTDHLLAAAEAAGATRFVAQSFGAFRFSRRDGAVFTEDEPLEAEPPVPHPGLDAILHLEQAVMRIGWGAGIVLRYGALYGPGTAISAAPDAQIAGPVRRRRFPIVGDGGGVTSYVHVDDAATATVQAVERGSPGIYNIVDDEPAAVRDWLPVLASALGAPPPRRIPLRLARLAAGPIATAMMTDGKGASNAKAKRELGWSPRYPSWRQGFTQGLG